MRKFDITVGFEMNAKNSFGAKETLQATQTKTYSAKDQETAVAEMEFDFRKQGIDVKSVSICERG